MSDTKSLIHFFIHGRYYELENNNFEKTNLDEIRKEIEYAQSSWWSFQCMYTVSEFQGRGDVELENLYF